MKKYMSVIALVIAAANANASNANVELIGKNTSVETNLCLTAAQHGYDAVSAEIKASNGKLAATKCNGKDIKVFAKSFTTKAPAKAINMKVITGNNSMESQLCMKAVKEGVNAVGHRRNSLKCNGLSVDSFVKSVKRS